jgi:hypothetical protein
LPQGAGYALGRVLSALTPTVPLALLAGEKDNTSKDAVEGVCRSVERLRLNKVELFPTPLHGYKLLRLEPKVAVAVTRFLEPAIKRRTAEWEPRYNLTPITVAEAQAVQHVQPAEKATRKEDQPRAGQQGNVEVGNASKEKALPKAVDQKEATKSLE